MTNTNSINARILYLRKNILNLSQQKFADALGVTQANVSRME